MESSPRPFVTIHCPICGPHAELTPTFPNVQSEEYAIAYPYDSPYKDKNWDLEYRGCADTEYGDPFFVCSGGYTVLGDDDRPLPEDPNVRGRRQAYVPKGCARAFSVEMCTATGVQTLTLLQSVRTITYVAPTKHVFKHVPTPYKVWYARYQRKLNANTAIPVAPLAFIKGL